MREIRSPGSVRGVPGNRHSYRDKVERSSCRSSSDFSFQERTLITPPSGVPFFHIQGLTPPLFSIDSAYAFKSLADIAIAMTNSFNKPKSLGLRLDDVFKVGHFPISNGSDHLRNSSYFSRKVITKAI